MARVKAKDYEDLSDTNIRKVLAGLNGSPPISKKDACEILKISYNTSRLTNILQDYLARKENIKRNRDKKKGRPATRDEIQFIVEEYMNGEPIGNISDRIYRSTNFIKAIVEQIGIPQRETGFSPLKPQFLPDTCVSEDFVKDEIAWSAQYRSKCKIVKREDDQKYIPKYGAPCYTVYVLGEGNGFFASTLSYDLGKLSHLEAYGINLNAF